MYALDDRIVARGPLAGFETTSELIVGSRDCLPAASDQGWQGIPREGPIRPATALSN